MIENFEIGKRYIVRAVPEINSERPGWTHHMDDRLNMPLECVDIVDICKDRNWGDLAPLDDVETPFLYKPEWVEEFVDPDLGELGGR